MKKKTSAQSSILVLASDSEEKQRLLQQVGIKTFFLEVADININAKKKETPKQFNKRLVIEKALFATKKLPQEYRDKTCFILATDNICTIGRRIIEKPEDIKHAGEILRQISGKTNRIYSSVALINPDGKISHRQSETRIYLKRLTDNEIEQYLQTEQWKNKPGAYSIQGKAAAFVIKIYGSYTGALGLNLYQTLSLLQGNGFQN